MSRAVPKGDDTGIMRDVESGFQNDKTVCGLTWWIKVLSDD